MTSLHLKRACNTNLPYHHFFSTFRFTSLIRVITPASTDQSLTASAFTDTELRKTSGRVSAKRSYLIFSWLHYLTFRSSAHETSCKVRITMLPTTQSFYTITKAPMAHKTRSKEQFIFKFYHFAITFKVNPELVVSSSSTSIESLAYVLILTKQLFPVFETNLLYLKYYRVRYLMCDQSFFTYE